LLCWGGGLGWVVLFSGGWWGGGGGGGGGFLGGGGGGGGGDRGVVVGGGAAGTEVEGTGIDHAGCCWVDPIRVAGAGSLESNPCLIDQLRSTAKKGVMVGPGSCL
jgi:hypothetical protein